MGVIDTPFGEYRLNRPPYTKDKNDPELVEFVTAFNEIAERVRNGTAFVKFVEGDRKGSIARVKFEFDDVNECSIFARNSWYNGEYTYEPNISHMYLVAYWEKRKNKCKVYIPNNDVIFLPNYDGPTIYQLFDAKAAQTEVLKNPNQTDIDGKVLAIGDEVLYINARYGTGFDLCHGTIKEFKAVVNSRETKISTIVQHASEDEVSTISNSSSMIFKKV